jgi:hypothetical protein
MLHLLLGPPGAFFATSLNPLGFRFDRCDSHAEESSSPLATSVAQSSALLLGTWEPRHWENGEGEEISSFAAPQALSRFCQSNPRCFQVPTNPTLQ